MVASHETPHSDAGVFQKVFQAEHLFTCQRDERQDEYGFLLRLQDFFEEEYFRDQGLAGRGWRRVDQVLAMVDHVRLSG